LIALQVSLEAIPPIIEVIKGLKSPIFKNLELPDPSFITGHIALTLVDDPPAKLGEGKVIRSGIRAELDELRSLKSNSQSWIAKYQGELKELTGIKTLKIIFSKAFGYCIEVSRGQADRMPLSFQRRQTLVSSERFISSELKSYEEKILTAEEKIHGIESTLYHNLQKELASHLETILQIARSIATIDVLYSLANVAKTYHFTRPLIDEGSEIAIDVGRHPVIEASLLDESFIPNDTHFKKGCSLLLITGPNMAGKSTYIRQVALITIMAQIGSFVPAKRCHIGIVDKVFSRIGASDDLSRGQSTFMIEMTETANILHNATPRSLVILDEIGRGTSTFDGISIAWAVAEHLLKIGCKTLFATHYWELTELEEKEKELKNVHVAVQEVADQIVFLRKIVEGSTDKSYGIHVARLAGLPQGVLKRAHEVLHQLEKKEMSSPPPPPQEQLSFFVPPSTELYSLAEEIEKIDLNHMTPFGAFEKIQEWKKRLQ
ncbi:MAG: DNA mismatch repair protein MutS, partial [Chlamydiia bacterium]|nr:DNA mismatch repair protein MutS [Chlamydiia bacterium]